MLNDNKKLCCDCNIIHREVVNKVAQSMVAENKLYDIAELFNVFGNFTRTRIISALFESEMCVCDISCLLNMTKSAVSHQLRILKNSKLVKYRREGKEVFYSLADDHIYEIFKIALEHINE